MLHIVHHRWLTPQELALRALVEMLSSLDLLESTKLLVEIIGEFHGSNTLLKKAMEGLVEECTRTSQLQRITDIIQALIQALIDATERNDFVC